MALPSDPKVRDIIRKRVKEAAQFLREMDILKEDIKQIKDACKEEYDIPPKEMGGWIKAEYDKNKLESQLEDIQTTLAEHDILNKG